MASLCCRALASVTLRPLGSALPRLGHLPLHRIAPCLSAVAPRHGMHSWQQQELPPFAASAAASAPSAAATAAAVAATAGAGIAIAASACDSPPSSAAPPRLTKAADSITAQCGACGDSMTARELVQKHRLTCSQRLLRPLATGAAPLPAGGGSAGCVSPPPSPYTTQFHTPLSYHAGPPCNAAESDLPCTTPLPSQVAHRLHQKGQQSSAARAKATMLQVNGRLAAMAKLPELRIPSAGLDAPKICGEERKGIMMGLAAALNNLVDDDIVMMFATFARCGGQLGLRGWRARRRRPAQASSPIGKSSG